MTNDDVTRVAAAMAKANGYDWGDLQGRGPDQISTRVSYLHLAKAAVAAMDTHDSDCATHNEPAYPNGPCDCSVAQAQQ